MTDKEKLKLVKAINKATKSDQIGNRMEMMQKESFWKEVQQYHSEEECEGLDPQQIHMKWVRILDGLGVPS